jgi:diguanylate cyclase (GGDEF)-like protein/hemerythrin-like metal-binding protein/PAS domain S-box-containing protein
VLVTQEPIENPPPPGSGSISSEAIESFEIFPWNEDFETGIATVDEQHQTLVRLLNKVARNLAFQSSSFTFAEIMRELSEYTVYHFAAEESLMAQFFGGDVLEAGHRKAHQDFVDKIGRLEDKYQSKPLDEVVEEIIAILTRWLAFHILDTDRRMAKVIFAVQSGLSVEQAKVQVDREMSGAVKVLVDAVLGMYERLSSRTFQLMKEIVERRSAEVQLRRATIVFENTLEAIFVTDSLRQIVDVNPSFCEISGQTTAELLGKTLVEVLASLGQENFGADIWQTVQIQGFWRGEVSSRSLTGESTPGWMTLSAVTDDTGTLTNYVGVLSNVTQLLKRQQQLERIANHDFLTGLPNRLFLFVRLGQAMAQARRSNDFLAVCYLDLDGFKAINDKFGHSAGDHLLQEIASRIQAVVRSNDTVARMGGDEFSILLGELKQPDDCLSLLERLLATIQLPVALPSGDAVTVTASIGVTLFPTDDGEPDELLQHADQAMYQAKESGKAKVHFYKNLVNSASLAASSAAQELLNS